VLQVGRFSQFPSEQHKRRKRMATELGMVLHRSNQARIQAWGDHCEWPPRWVVIPQGIKEFTAGYPGEIEQSLQGIFQQKVREALHRLYHLDTESMSIEELMDWARRLPFWIADNGTPCFRFLPLWE